MRQRFLPKISDADVAERLAHIAEEMKIYDEQMPVSRFLYLSDRVSSIWEAKASAVQENKVYIGGGRK
jgi:hypothetical protein